MTEELARPDLAQLLRSDQNLRHIQIGMTTDKDELFSKWTRNFDKEPNEISRNEKYSS